MFNGPLSGTTQVSQYQKGKTIWILLEQETVSGSGISWAGLGFFHGKNYFCLDSGKKTVKTVAKTSKNRQKLAKSKTP